MSSPDSRRSPWLDWSRLLAVLLLIPFHSAAVFYRGELGDFYITNSDLSTSLSSWVLFVHQWHMPLFFFLAGSASWYSLRARSGILYLRERLLRLLVPLVLGIPVLVPLQVYLKEWQQLGTDDNFWQFYPHFFDGIRPNGHFEWAHLWFLAYLLVISLACLPLMLHWRKRDAQSDLLGVSLRLPDVASLLVLAVPLMLSEALLRPRWIGFQNLTDDWANLLLYLVYFLYGHLFSRQQRLWEALDRHGGVVLLAAGVAMAALLTLQISGAVPERSYSTPFMLFQAWRGLNSWCWVLALLVLARRYLNRDHPVLHYGSQAALPIYLLHQPLLVLAAALVVPLELAIPAKFVLISLAGLLVSLAVYEGLIRRLQVLRFCFGLASLR